MVEERKVTSKSKHFDRNLFFISEELMKGNINVKHVPGETLDADILTKNLPIAKTQEIAKALRLFIGEEF